MTDSPAEQITLTNFEVTAGSRGRYKIYGEAVNNSSTELSAILGGRAGLWVGPSFCGRRQTSQLDHKPHKNR